MFLISFTSHSSAPSTQPKGFGLIELLVSISIMVIIASVVLVRQSSFNGAVLLRSQAYEIALELRNAQLNAVSSTGQGGVFRAMVGVHFDTANPNTYRIFRDSTSGSNSDNFYNASEEFGQQGLIDPRFVISQIRADGSVISGTDLSVVFERPNFDARFFDAANSEVTAAIVEIDVRRVGTVGTGSGDVRTVEVTSAGQVAVQ